MINCDREEGVDVTEDGMSDAVNRCKVGEIGLEEVSISLEDGFDDD